MGNPLLDRANELLKSGKPALAAKAAAEAVAADPKDAEARNTLGTALAQTGDAAGAERAYLAAAAADPGLYKPHANLANLYAKTGRTELAAARLREAVRLEPNAARLWARLGQAAAELGTLGEARQALERALALEDTVAHRTALARVLLAGGGAGRALELLATAELGENADGWALFAEACHACAHPALERALDAASRLEQSGAAALHLAQIALEANQFDRALVFGRRARAAAANPADDHVVLLEAACLEALGRGAEALALLDSGFNAQPTIKKAVELAALAQRTGQGERAVEPLQAARVLFQDSADVLVAWGRLARSRRDFDVAHRAFEAALALDPEHAGGLFALGVSEATLAPSTRALELLEHAARAAPTDPAPTAALLFAELHALRWTPEERRERHASYARRYCQVRRTSGGAATKRDPGTRLRVGYLSADFRDHALMRFCEGILAGHDRGKVEVFVYGSVASPDAVTHRIQALDLSYRDVSALSDAALAARIAEDRVDVLVALDGHTAAARLRALAYRPAPVVVSYLGYPATTGIPQVGYRITDAVADPAGNEAHYTETLVRLPHTAWCFGPAPALPVDRDEAAPLTFASFNRSAKLSDALLGCFRRILEGAPDARLLLKAPTSESARLAARVTEILGPSAARVELLPWTPKSEDHLSTYRGVDVALDSFPYAGTTTTAEALWMGVPVVTLAGVTHVERVGASLLDAVALGDLVTTSTDEYVARALALAADTTRRTALRRELRERMRAGPLGDPGRFVPAFEACLEDLAGRAKLAEPPPGTRHVETDVGARLVVPDSLETVTTFVVQEQQRWFEDEVDFVRSLVQPGDVVVDVGANLGVYAIEAARIAGPSGRVVAFEPSTSTAAMLRASAASNALSNVVVHQVALGESRGVATLLIGGSPELSRLGSGPGASEDVPLETLGTFEEEIRGMRFLKLDAEGSEEAILRASGELVAREAPVMMFELRHGDRVNTGLIDAVRRLGFEVYRLCPGLDVLVPFSAGELDPFQLNLFGVRPERAAELAARGILAERRDAKPAPASDEAVASWLKARPVYAAAGLDGAAVPPSVRWLVAAEDRRSLPAERFAALVEAERAASLEVATAPSPGTRLTFARVALALGARTRGVDMARSVIEARSLTARPKAVFACPLSAYEAASTFDPEIAFVAQAIEVEVRFGAFSSFYQKPAVLEAVKSFFHHRGTSPSMDRRLGLLLARAGLLT